VRCSRRAPQEAVEGGLEHAHLLARVGCIRFELCEHIAHRTIPAVFVRANPAGVGAWSREDLSQLGRRMGVGEGAGAFPPAKTAFSARSALVICSTITAFAGSASHDGSKRIASSIDASTSGSRDRRGSTSLPGLWRSSAAAAAKGR
jgi:hypothetical protein